MKLNCVSLFKDFIIIYEAIKGGSVAQDQFSQWSLPLLAVTQTTGVRHYSFSFNSKSGGYDHFLNTVCAADTTNQFTSCLRPLGFWEL